MGVSRSEPFISWCFIRVKVDNKNILYAVVCLRVHVRTCVSTDAHMQMCKVRRQLCISVLSFVFGIWRSHLGHHQACIAVAAYDIALSIQTQFFSYWVGFGDLLLEVFLFKIYFILYVSMFCLCVCLWTPCAGRGQKRVSDLWVWSYRYCEATMWVLFTAELSPVLDFLFFFLLRQDLAVYLWLAWKSRGKQGWLLTMNPPGPDSAGLCCCSQLCVLFQWYWDLI